MNHNERETDNYTTERTMVIIRIRNAEDNKYEDECEKDLNDKTCSPASVNACKTVRSQTAGHIRNLTHAENDLEASCTTDSA